MIRELAGTGLKVVSPLVQPGPVGQRTDDILLERVEPLLPRTSAFCLYPQRESRRATDASRAGLGAGPRSLSSAFFLSPRFRSAFWSLKVELMKTRMVRVVVSIARFPFLVQPSQFILPPGGGDENREAAVVTELHIKNSAGLVKPSTRPMIPLVL